MERPSGRHASAVRGGRAGGRRRTQVGTRRYADRSGPSRHAVPGGGRQVGALGDGTPVSVRPLVAADRAWFAEWIAALSDQSKYRRFFSCPAELPAGMLDRLVDDVDGVQHVAFVVTVPAETGSRAAPPSWPDVATVPVAVGRFIRLRTDGDIAEVACTVTDAWQRRGVGTLLMATLVTAARALGVTTFTATVLTENRPSLRLFPKAGRVTRREADGYDAVDLDVELAVAPASTPPAQPHRVATCRPGRERRCRQMKPGDLAADFELPDEEGKLRKLSDLLAAGPVVLFFFPAAMTPGCTAQSRHFRDLKVEFDRVGAQRVGISVDPVAKQKEFAAANCFDYPLLSDTDGEVARRFGVRRRFGPVPVKRTTFVIDPDRQIRAVIHSELRMNAHADLALEALRAGSS